MTEQVRGNPRKTHEAGPKGGRIFIGLRLRLSGITWLDSVADESGTNRTAVVRACIALGRAHKRELLTLLKEDQ